MMNCLVSFVLLLLLWNITVCSSECPSTEFSECASEGGTCNVAVSGSIYLSYGAQGEFILMQAVITGNSGSFACSNSYFGDPIFGVSKSCCYAAADFSDVGYDSRSFTYCAEEGNNCPVNVGDSFYWIKYGADPHYRYTLIQSSSRSIACTNTVMKEDPYPFVHKKCSKSGPLSSSTMGYLTSTYTYPDMQCYEDSNERNDWDGSHNNIQSSYFMNGQTSYHNNHREDRRFKWRYCRPSNDDASFTSTSSLSITGYDEEWTRSCNGKNSGHSGMIGGTSYHDNHREDRQWTFQCGDLDILKYRLVDCSWSGQLNGYDHGLDYDCPNNRIIRSIWSQHSNNHEDRIWKFECCAIRDSNYEFSDIIGQWVELINCQGCDSSTYSTTNGVRYTQSESITSSYTNSLSIAVSAGFEYKVGSTTAGLTGSASVTVEGTVSQTTSNTLTNSFSTMYTVGLSVQCSKSKFFQWRTSATEIYEGSSTTIDIHSVYYVCTDESDPQCPAGWCRDITDNDYNGDCQRPCKDGYPDGY